MSSTPMELMYSKLCAVVSISPTNRHSQKSKTRAIHEMAQILLIHVVYATKHPLVHLIM